LFAVVVLSTVLKITRDRCGMWAAHSSRSCLVQLVADAVGGDSQRVCMHSSTKYSLRRSAPRESVRYSV